MFVYLIAIFTLLNSENALATAYAKIENGIVVDKKNVEAEEVAKWSGTWIRIRKPEEGAQPGEAADIGDTYDPVEKKFWRPKPFPSWKKNKNTVQWEPPIPEPKNGKDHLWDESKQEYKLAPVQPVNKGKAL